jgi:hypothetical protein
LLFNSRSLSSLLFFLFSLSTLFFLSYTLAENSKSRAACELRILNVGGARKQWERGFL